MAAALAQETYEPSESSNAEIARVHDFLAAHAGAGRGDIEPHYFLSGAEVGDQVEIPAAVHGVLLQVVEAMRLGLAVTVTPPQNRTLTTQQAADLLQLSRPTVIRLLDSSEIPFERIGTHRRINLQDVLVYRERRRARQYELLAELDARDDDADLNQTLAELKIARKELAGRRRAARAK